MVEGIFDGHGLDGGEDRDPRRAEPDLREQIDRVLNDVALGVEIGKDVDRRVGDEQRLGIGRHVHDEDMTDAPRGAQAGLARRHLAHQLVGVQAALHQQLALAPRGSARPPSPPPPRCAAHRRSRSDRYRAVHARATAAIFAAGPTRIGTMMPASAASIGAAQRGLVAGMRPRSWSRAAPAWRARSAGRIWIPPRPPFR